MIFKKHRNCFLRKEDGPMITPYQREYFRENAKVYLDDIKRMVDKHLRINDVNVYHVQTYLRKIYKQNQYLNLGMSYSDFIREIIKPGTIVKSYEDVIYSEIDYKLNTIVKPKIFFY